MSRRDTGFSAETRSLITARSGGRCEIRWCCDGDQATQIHHRRPRGMGGSKRASTNLASNGIHACEVPDPARPVRINVEDKTMSDVVERVEGAIRMAIQAAAAARMEDHPDSRAHLVWAYDEAPGIAQYVTTSRSWRELTELVAEVESLRGDLDFYREWSNDLTQYIPEEFDDDIAQEAIISHWASSVSAEVKQLRAVIERVRDVVEQHATRGIGQRILDALVVPDE